MKWNKFPWCIPSSESLYIVLTKKLSAQSNFMYFITYGTWNLHEGWSVAPNCVKNELFEQAKERVLYFLDEADAPGDLKFKGLAQELYFFDDVSGLIDKFYEDSTTRLAGIIINYIEENRTKIQQHNIDLAEDSDGEDEDRDDSKAE